ncbi:uncharacterized protein LOC128792048 isoform X2 [Vidua chalybeata]|uniref:uncharacterized protein LOC128792048 isoform X2 n=1 Tax=Vidua chalybeata TaxID=81927 RepID=UPI0023A8606C|nr:uncharacterized protein LOC128792048 isoform X2 [Vidua chalybeata]
MAPALAPVVPMPDSAPSRWPARLCRQLSGAAGPRELLRLPRLRCRAGSRPARSVGSASRSSPRPAVLNEDLVAVPRAPVGGWPCRALRAVLAHSDSHRVWGRLSPLHLLRGGTPPLLRHLCRRVSGELDGPRSASELPHSPWPFPALATAPLPAWSHWHAVVAAEHGAGACRPSLHPSLCPSVSPRVVIQQQKEGALQQ